MSSTTLAMPAAQPVPPAPTVQNVQVHRRPATATSQGPWSVEAIQALLDKPLMDLLFEAQAAAE